MRRRNAHLVFSLLFLMALIVMIGLLIAGRNNLTDFYENRTLAERPATSREAVMDGSWVNEWETFLTDHVKGRTWLIKADTALHLRLLHQPVVNGVLVTKERLLGFNSYGRWDTDYLADSAEQAACELEDAFSDYISRGGTVLYLALPEQYSYYRTYYPSYTENRQWLLEPMHAVWMDALERHGIPCVDMYEVYETMGVPEEMYSATDHHYSYYGAYCAYRTAMETIGQMTTLTPPVLEEEDLRLTALPNPYLGSRNRKLYGLAFRDEQLVYAEPVEPIPFERIDNGWYTEPWLYELPETEDEVITYNVYMGGDHGETILRTNREYLPDLLIVGESFTNALEPLFYASFDETRSLDPRFYGGGLTMQEYLADFDPDVVVVVRDDTAYFNPLGM